MLEELEEELAHRRKVDAFFDKFAPDFDLNRAYEVKDWSCYRLYINTYEEYCEKFSDYSLKYGKMFAHACDVASGYTATDVISFFQENCTQ